MKVIQVAKPGGTLDLVERDIPAVKPGWVRIKIHACGVCHSDMLMKEGYWPGLQYPRVPGHEAAGVIDEVGPDVKPWVKGQRVGVGLVRRPLRDLRTVPPGPVGFVPHRSHHGIHS